MKWWWIKCAMLFAFVRKRISIIKFLISVLLILSLSGCSSKAASRDVISFSKNFQQTRTFSQKLSQKISETSPPEVIQELRGMLDAYQPQVRIVSPHADEVLQENNVRVRFDIKDLPIFQDSKLGLGSHLNVILDNDPLQFVYDVNQPLELSDLSPGTHTLRVFAASPWNESFKNEGAYAQTSFHVFTKSEDNNPDKNLPLLTYGSPQGDYGAEPILLDFYLTNAPLHLLSQNSDNEIGDWRIRCTINGESFILDRWQSLYLKGFKIGQNWVKLEFIDGQGNTVKNVFNSTLKTINYQPKGKDTLSKIVRGELSAEKVRSIVNPNYTNATPIVEPDLESDTELEPKIKSEIKPEIKPELELEIIKEANPNPENTENSKAFTDKSQIENLEEEETEKDILGQSEKSKSSNGFLKRFQRPKESKPSFQDTVEKNTVEVEPTPNVLSIPETIETPASKEKLEAQIKPNTEKLEQPETKSLQEIPQTSTKLTPELTPEEIKKPETESEDISQTSQNQSKLSSLKKYFQRRDSDTKSDTKEIVPSPPNPVIQVPEVEKKEEVTPSDNNEAPEISIPQMNTEPVPKLEVDKPSAKKDFGIKDFGKYFKLNKETSPDTTPETEVEIEPTPQLPPTLPEIVEPPVIQPEIEQKQKN